MSPAALHRSLAAWWGFAEADRAVLGLVVAALAVLAVSYVLVRLVRTRAARRVAAPTRGAAPSRRRG